MLTAQLFLDIKSLTISNPSLVSELGPAFEKYNEEQFTTVKLPGGSQQVCELRTLCERARVEEKGRLILRGKVIVSSHSSLGDGRYYDVESSSSFVFDHSKRASLVCSRRI
jgi:F-actin capping protein alpha subunit